LVDEFQPLQDLLRHISRRVLPRIDVSINREQARNLAVADTHEHHFVVAPILDQLAHNSRLKMTPFLLVIVLADEDNDERGIVLIDPLQVRVEVRACELSEEIAVIENFLSPQLARQLHGYTFYERPMLAWIRQRDAESSRHG
jgi:hypothetical protein